jgi:DNA repair protein RecN (Recombination protein N)
MAPCASTSSATASAPEGSRNLLEKRESEGRTKTRIRTLDDEARTHEVARMLSGAIVTGASLQHAAQMIASSR